MYISTIERTVLEKCAKDAGWEIDPNAPADYINLFSSFFRETGSINKNTDKSFVVRFTRVLSPSHFDADIHFNSNGDSEFSLQETASLSGLLKRVAELFASLPDNPLEQYQKKLAEFSDTEIQKTEAERLVKERVGQDIYRDALMNYWGGASSVTGCTLKDALRASHAKPLKDCTSDAERLNVYNGFLLTANLDALFDKGYISFTNDGLITVSSIFEFERDDIKGLGINSNMKLRWVEEKHIEFLDYHHKKVWKS
jgi:hypothetical protein